MKNGKIVEGGSTFWYKNGMIHREDGPAIILPNGTESWFLNGKLHRLDGPAVLNSYKDKEWWIDDKLHREDGPAVMFSNGKVEWWLKSIQLTKEEWWEQLSDDQKLKIIFSKRGQLEN
jgi:hypothetical protein